MNNIDFHGIEEIWSSLSTSSLLWLTVTLAAYLFAQKLYKWSNWNSLLNPVAVSIVTVVLLLMATHTPYQTYFSGAQFISAGTDNRCFGRSSVRPQNSVG